MKKIIIFLAFFSMIIFILFVCNHKHNKSNDKIIVTTGMSENPYSKRIGIELTVDTIFFCVEKSPRSMKYDFYYSLVSIDTLIKYKTIFNKEFFPIDNSSRVVDGQEIFIYTQFENIKSSYILNIGHLNELQSSIINNFIQLKNKVSPLIKIKYHFFSKEVLYKQRQKFIPPQK